MARPDDLVRFDWAIKRLLRNKADYVVVEGLLTCLLGKKIFIKNMLESESNKETADDKFNRVDLLAQDEEGELILFEIQNDHQLDYFQRMAYGTSKTLAEYLKEGDAYKNIKKLKQTGILNLIHHCRPSCGGCYGYPLSLLFQKLKKFSNPRFQRQFTAVIFGMVHNRSLMSKFVIGKTFSICIKHYFFCFVFI